METPAPPPEEAKSPEVSADQDPLTLSDQVRQLLGEQFWDGGTPADPALAEKFKSPPVSAGHMNDLRGSLQAPADGRPLGGPPQQYRPNPLLPTAPLVGGGSEPIAGTLTHTGKGAERSPTAPIQTRPPKPKVIAGPVELARFIMELRDTGRVSHSARVAGISYGQANAIRRADKEFATLWEEAMVGFREGLEEAAYTRAVTGWDVPIYSQKTGTLLGHETKYDSRLMELMLKRHIPEYREKFEGEIKVTGGVLVAPVSALSAADWASRHGAERLPECGPPGIIDAPATTASLPAPDGQPPQEPASEEPGTPQQAAQ